MFLCHLNMRKQLTCEKKMNLRNILRRNIFAKKNKQLQLVCAQFYFFIKTTSNINYNTELKNNYISDKYNNDYLQI